MVRTVHQTNAYCEHALKSGMPVEEIIDALANEGMSEEVVRQGLAVAMKRAKKNVDRSNNITVINFKRPS